MRSLLGLTLAGVPAFAMAYLSEEMHPDSIGLAMGLYIGGGAIGGMGGRLLVGVVTDYFGWRVGLDVMSLVVLAACGVCRSEPPGPRAHERPPAPPV